MLFQDSSTGERDKRYLLSVSKEEMDFLHKVAKEKGVHVSILVRRVLKVALVEKPDLFNLFSP